LLTRNDLRKTETQAGSGTSLHQSLSLDLPVLLEADVGGALTEALTAHVEVVLADKTRAGSADTALAGALAVLAGVGVLEVRHDVLVNC